MSSPSVSETQLRGWCTYIEDDVYYRHVSMLHGRKLWANVPKSSIRDVVWNWTKWRTRDLRPSGRILLTSLEPSVCGVVIIRLPGSRTGVERTSLSLASKKVYPEWPVDSHVNFFCNAVRLGVAKRRVGDVGGVLACS
jgi:hypothetical protein